MRVVIADDAPLIRQGLAMVLSAAGISVVAQVGDGDGLCAAVGRLRPDVAISDVRMPPSQTVEGLRAAAWIQARHPDVGMLLLSNHAESRHLGTLLAGRTAGLGYLLKERIVDADGFAADVRSVARGGTVLDPEIVQLLMTRQGSRRALAALTPRERDVLATMAGGASNVALGRQLRLSPKTVEAHIASIFRKLGLHADADEHRRVKAVLTYLHGS